MRAQTQEAKFQADAAADFAEKNIAAFKRSGVAGKHAVQKARKKIKAREPTPRESCSPRWSIEIAQLDHSARILQLSLDPDRQFRPRRELYEQK